MIGIVTVNWHGCDVTRNLVLQMLENQHQDFRLVVVNNSPDEAETLDQDDIFKDPRVMLIHARENSGYSGGLNTGIKALLPRPEISHFLLMNNDVEIARDFIPRMLAEGRAKDKIYAPLIMLRDTNLVQNTGGKVVLWLGGTINLNKNVPAAEIRKQQPGFLSGCILLMPRGVIEKVGLFDQSFGSYYEDVDFCLRARAAGVGVEILWDIQARHFHSHSTKGDSSYKVYLLNRNQILFARKHLPPLQRVVFIAAALLRGLVMNISPKRIRAYFQGVKEGLECSILSRDT